MPTVRISTATSTIPLNSLVLNILLLLHTTISVCPCLLYCSIALISSSFVNAGQWHIGKIKLRICKLPQQDNWKVSVPRWYGSEDPDPESHGYPDSVRSRSSVISAGSCLSIYTILRKSADTSHDFIPASIIDCDLEIQSTIILCCLFQLHEYGF